MKNKAIKTGSLTFFFLAFLILTGCTQAPKDVTDEIKQANKEFMKAIKNGDANAISMIYTSDAKLFPPNKDVIEGRETIKNVWSFNLKMGIKEAIVKTLSAESYGNTAIEEGRYELYAKGHQMLDQGKYIVIWKKEDGQWKLQKDIWNTSNPAPPIRAKANDTVWVVQTHVKADKLKQFEDFNINYLAPAAREADSEVRSTVRILKPVKQNTDGTYTYIYMLDPMININRYGIVRALTFKYGKEKADKYFRMFKDCLKDNDQEVLKTIQTSW